MKKIIVLFVFLLFSLCNSFADGFLKKELDFDGQLNTWYFAKTDEDFDAHFAETVKEDLHLQKLDEPRWDSLKSVWVTAELIKKNYPAAFYLLNLDKESDYDKSQGDFSDYKYRWMILDSGRASYIYCFKNYNNKKYMAFGYSYTQRYWYYTYDCLRLWNGDL